MNSRMIGFRPASSLQQDAVYYVFTCGNITCRLKAFIQLKPGNIDLDHCSNQAKNSCVTKIFNGSEFELANTISRPEQERMLSGNIND